MLRVIFRCEIMLYNHIFNYFSPDGLEFMNIHVGKHGCFRSLMSVNRFCAIVLCLLPKHDRQIYLMSQNMAGMSITVLKSVFILAQCLLYLLNVFGQFVCSNDTRMSTKFLVAISSVFQFQQSFEAWRQLQAVIVLKHSIELCCCETFSDDADCQRL